MHIDIADDGSASLVDNIARPAQADSSSAIEHSRIASSSSPMKKCKANGISSGTSNGISSAHPLHDLRLDRALLQPRKEARRQVRCDRSLAQLCAQRGPALVRDAAGGRLEDAVEARVARGVHQQREVREEVAADGTARIVSDMSCCGFWKQQEVRK